VQGKRPVYIIGAGDFGREVESMLDSIPVHQRDWAIAGFVDDNSRALENRETDYEVVGSVEGLSFPSGSLAVLTISEPGIREAVYRKLAGRVTFMSFVHPTAVLFKFVKMDEGVFVGAQCVLSNSVHLGRFVILNQGTQIGHDSTVGEFSALMSNVDIGGRCDIGARTFIGTGATLVPGIRIASGAKVGSGSVVLRKVKENTTVFGVPAKVIAER